MILGNVALNNEIFLLKCLSFLKENQYIFPILIITFAIVILIKIAKRRKQYKTENDITQMFNEDGERTFFRNHKHYDIITPLFVEIFIILLWIVLNAPLC